MLVFNIKVGDALAFSDGRHKGRIDFVSIDASSTPRRLWFNLRYKDSLEYYYLEEFTSMNLPIGEDFRLYVNIKHLTPTKASFIFKPLQGMQFTFIKNGTNKKKYIYGR